MTTLTLPLPSGTRRPRILKFVSELIGGIREAQELAGRYRTLANLTDSELASLGLKREDIPRAVMLGKGA